MHQHPLTIEIRPDSSSVTLVLAGELDLASVGTLRVCLEQLDHQFRHVVVDLQELTFLDSSGLNVLVGTQRALAHNGATLSVCNPSEQVRRVLEVSGVDGLLSVGS